MGQLLRDADGVVEASLLWWRQLFPLRRRSPGEFSPIDVWVNRRVLKEGVECGGVVICHLEETFECPDAGALFFEKLDDCFSFSFIGSGGVRR